jgi:hypothetical protein
MQKPLKLFLIWVPRVLGILFILFVSLFSLDVFGTGAGFWDTLLAFVMHNIPTFLLLAVLLLAWRWEWIGAVGFWGFVVWFVLQSRGESSGLSLLLLGGIPFVIGLLYLVGWIWRKQIRAK